jgi:hypothetical protein
MTDRRINHKFFHGFQLNDNHDNHVLGWYSNNDKKASVGTDSVFD